MSDFAMRDIAIRRLRAVVLPDGKGLPAAERAVVLAELAKLGYMPKNAILLERFAGRLSADAYKHNLTALAKLRGGDVKYVPLFAGFPDKVPDEDKYFLSRLIGYIGNLIGWFPGDAGTTLDNGFVVPSWLFDLDAFGADPITQMQDAGLFERQAAAQDKREGDSHVEWVPMLLVLESELDERLAGWARSVLYANASVKEALHADLMNVLGRVGAAVIDPVRVTFRETRTLLLKHYWALGRYDEVVRLAQTPTDLLRLFATLTETDVSLAGPVRFPRLTRAQRRAVLGVLEKSPALLEDMGRYRGLWIAAGAGLHPGAEARRFPKTAKAFERLRAGETPSFAGRVNELLQKRRIGDALTELCTRPGEFSRRLHALLRTFPQQRSRILDQFGEIVGAVPLKNLFVLRRYFATINDREERFVVTKRGRMKVLPNNALGALTPQAVEAIDRCLAGAIECRLAARDSWAGKRVWIDPALDRVAIPLQQRAASDGLLTLDRGSRIPLDSDKVLRLFVWWKEAHGRTDLDLSAIQFGPTWDYRGHVSFTRLAADGIVHSGDIQSAPHGAAEFIDITLSKLPKGVTKIAVQVYRYAGDAFADMEAISGWMVRDRVDSSIKSFDVKTVQNAFRLTGRAAYSIPLVVDLERREVLLTDLYVGGRSSFNYVEGAQDNVAALCRQVESFTSTRPTMGQLALAHAVARHAEIVEDRDAGEVTFGIRDCDFNATEVEKVLAELL